MIDTLKYTEVLEKAGFTTEQSRKSVQIMAEIMEKNLATKQDMALGFEKVDTEFTSLRKDMALGFEKVDTEFTSLRKDMALGFERVDRKFDEVANEFTLLRKDMTNEFASVKKDMTIKLGSLMVLSLTLLTAIHKFL